MTSQLRVSWKVQYRKHVIITTIIKIFLGSPPVVETRDLQPSRPGAYRHQTMNAVMSQYFIVLIVWFLFRIMITIKLCNNRAVFGIFSKTNIRISWDFERFLQTNIKIWGDLGALRGLDLHRCFLPTAIIDWLAIIG